jgi:beta-1,4-mannosyltransferase
LRILAWPAFKNKDNNAYNFLLYTSIVSLGHKVDELTLRNLFRHRYDVFHIHWLEPVTGRHGRLRALLRTAAFLLLLLHLRLRGTSLVWTAHNEMPHASAFPSLDHNVRRMVGYLADVILSLSPSSVEVLKQQFPMKTVKLTHHGHFVHHFPLRDNHNAAKTEFGFDEEDFVILFFGQIAQYKNVPVLINTFKELAAPRVKLLIGGYCVDAALQEHISMLASTNDSIRVTFHRVPDGEVGKYFAASNMTVLPYKRILNSSSAVLSLSFGRPFLGPKMNALKDLQTMFGPDNVYLYEGDLTASILQSAIDRARIVSGDALRRQVETKLDWRDIAQATLGWYRSERSSRRSGVSNESSL